MQAERTHLGRTRQRSRFAGKRIVSGIDRTRSVREVPEVQGLPEVAEARLDAWPGKSLCPYVLAPFLVLGPRLSWKSGLPIAGLLIVGKRSC